MRSTRTFDPVLWLDNLRVVNKEGAFTQAEKDLIDGALSSLQRELRKQHEQSDMVARMLGPLPPSELAKMQEKGEECVPVNDANWNKLAAELCISTGVEVKHTV